MAKNQRDLSAEQRARVQEMLGEMMVEHITQQKEKLFAGLLGPAEKKLLFDWIKYYDVAMSGGQDIPEQIMDGLDLSQFSLGD